MNKFFRRLMLFVFGFLFSSIFVYFFMYQNRDLPAFWPEGKVIEKINKSNRISDADSCYYGCLGWDETQLKAAINEGDVYFSKSKPRNKPCSEYIIEVENPLLKTVRLNISSCDSTFAVLGVFSADDAQRNLCECK
jgi:hypothetical protein